MKHHFFRVQQYDVNDGDGAPVCPIKTTGWMLSAWMRFNDPSSPVFSKQLVKLSAHI